MTRTRISLTVVVAAVVAGCTLDSVRDPFPSESTNTLARGGENVVYVRSSRDAAGVFTSSVLFQSSEGELDATFRHEDGIISVAGSVDGHSFGADFVDSGSDLFSLSLYQNDDDVDLIDVPLDGPGAGDIAAFEAFADRAKTLVDLMVVADELADAAIASDLDETSLVVVRSIVSVARGGDMQFGALDRLVRCVKDACAISGGRWCHACGVDGQCQNVTSALAFVLLTMECIDSFIQETTV